MQFAKPSRKYNGPCRHYSGLPCHGRDRAKAAL